jgi:hypothetical protein
MAPEGNDALRLALQGLRRRRDEAQLTQFIAGVARTDRRFAGRLAGVLVAAAPEGAKFIGADTEVPSQLVCEAEERVWDVDANSKGFVDLLFRSEDGAFTLLAELKLHSGYGREQVKRYLAGLEVYRAMGGPDSQAGLLSVTRNPPVYGEPEKQQGWLGSVRWADVLDALKAIEHRDPDVTVLWRAVLDILDRQGDFGVHGIDIDDVRAWARYTAGRKQLIRLLEEISQPSMTVIREALADHGGGDMNDELARLVRRGKQQKSVVFPAQERVHLRVAIPATHSGYRLRLQFRPGPDGPRFAVEARHPDARKLPPAVQANLRVVSERLRSEWGMQSAKEVTDFRTYWRRPRPLQEWAGDGGRGVVDRLMALVREDVHTLVRSGLLSETDGLCFRTAMPEPPAEADEPEDGNEGDQEAGE